jgi:D-lactate dehydrogenase (cytochrome)
LADLTAYLDDAAHFPGGHAAGIVFPRTIAEVAAAVASGGSVLAIGAQSSLTGGATPMGELIVATAGMNQVLEETPATITVQAGITVAEMQQHLARRGAWFPPAPTFTGACAGGIVATNAAGAATFKYGSTREWVEAITLVLADGSLLRLRRGEITAAAGSMMVAGVRVALPTYRMPAVVKKSAGYFAAPDMDAVDLFIGSEGTLGVIVDVTFRVLSAAPNVAVALIPCQSEEQAVRLAGRLRDASIASRTQTDRGIDTAAIENVDRRCIEILVEDGVATRENVSIPDGTEMILFVQLELPSEVDAARAYEQIAAASDLSTDAALTRFCRMLSEEDLLDVATLAAPGDGRRFRQLIAVREAVPAGVNQRVGIAQHRVDPRITKTAADMAVPFEGFAEMNAIYRRGFESRGLDYAIWGHISDGNVHPNVIPRTYEDVERGREAILEFGRAAVRLGGCPLAEHGVGRSAIKQELLRQLYGDEGIEQMRALKTALDPAWKLAPGVIFERHQ